MTWVRWRIVAVLMAISFVNYFNRISMPAAGGPIMRELGLSETQMGWVYSSLLIAYTLFMVPGGWFSDRQGAWVALVLHGVRFGGVRGLDGAFGRDRDVGGGAGLSGLVAGACRDGGVHGGRFTRRPDGS